MRAQAMPGENPETLPHPSVIAANILQLASPSLTETGGLFDAREEKWKPYLASTVISCHKARLSAGSSLACSMREHAPINKRRASRRQGKP